jgi:hypothetical protein
MIINIKLKFQAGLGVKLALLMSFLSVFTSIMMMMYFALAGSWFGRAHHVLPVSAPVSPGHPVIDSDWTRSTQVVSLSHPAAGSGFAAAQFRLPQPAVIGSSAIGKTTGRTLFLPRTLL